MNGELDSGDKVKDDSNCSLVSVRPPFECKMPSESTIETISNHRKREFPDDLPPWRRLSKDHRRHQTQTEPRHTPDDDGRSARKEQGSFARTQNRLNQVQEAQQMAEWVSKEDEFVLKQAKKKARIRVKEGRAKTIDWLASTLSVLEPFQESLEDEDDQSEVDVVDPTGLLEDLSHEKLQELIKDIDTYLTLETAISSRRYWNVRVSSFLGSKSVDGYSRP